MMGVVVEKWYIKVIGKNRNEAFCQTKNKSCVCTYLFIYLYFQIFSLHFPSLFITNRGKFFSNSFFFLNLRSLILQLAWALYFVIFHFLLFAGRVSTFYRELWFRMILWPYKLFFLDFESYVCIFCTWLYMVWIFAQNS